jgi:hypothetical protein
MDAKKLNELANNLFSKRSSLTSLWQEIADNFYPERADFTYKRSIGTDFAAGLMTTYPSLVRRDLGDQIGAMLRHEDWFHIATEDERREDNESKKWLQWATRTMRRAMYDKKSLFTRATKIGDHDYATFGQCVLTIELNRNANGLLYRSWHPKNVVWQDNADEKIACVFHKMKFQARDMLTLFKSVHQSIRDLADKDPFREVEVKRMVCESSMYDAKTDLPYYSIYYDCDHDFVMEELPSHSLIYVIPRWMKYESQYAYSPCTVVGLPEGRLLQAMTKTLLEAGEKAVNPPMVAQKDVVRGDVVIFAGGLTWVDRDYDERYGEALRQMQIDTKGMPLSREMIIDSRQLLSQAFFLNKLAMPPSEREMTAYEVAQRIQEYIRGALPLFAPMEDEYNGAVCEETFNLMLRNGAFGSVYDMPMNLVGADIRFNFKSPFHDAIDSKKGALLLQSRTLIADAVALDPSSANIVDVKEALRDALEATVPARWLRSKTEVEDIEFQQRQAAQTQQLLAGMEQASNVAKNLGQAQGAVPA